MAIRLDILKVNGSKESPVSGWTVVLNLVTLPVSVLPQLFPGTKGFLLVSIMNTLYRISLTYPGAQHRLLLL